MNKSERAFVFGATGYTGQAAVARLRSSAPRARVAAFEHVTVAQRVGSRMASRLAEMCAFGVVEAPDFRARLTPVAERS